MHGTFSTFGRVWAKILLPLILQGSPVFESCRFERRPTWFGPKVRMERCPWIWDSFFLFIYDGGLQLLLPSPSIFNSFNGTNQPSDHLFFIYIHTPTNQPSDLYYIYYIHTHTHTVQNDSPTASPKSWFIPLPSRFSMVLSQNSARSHWEYYCLKSLKEMERRGITKKITFGEGGSACIILLNTVKIFNLLSNIWSAMKFGGGLAWSSSLILIEKSLVKEYWLTHGVSRDDRLITWRIVDPWLWLNKFLN